ncbi:MAG: cytochrome c biogenesis protein CcsA [Phycisphaerales bacterium]|nr:cytochrome c biogenesis protein CcsA [Phycisphaerales bacterium]
MRHTRHTHSIIALLVALLPLAVASAQTAPAGNSPQREVLTARGESNPFGEATPRSTATVQQKYDFAQKLNLRPLRDLAIYHSGRVKIIDSLAREAIGDLTGRKAFQDITPETSADGKTKYRKLTHDPVFTFIDMIIDPAYYEDKPLLGVSYLPLREKLLELEFPGADKEDTRESWKRTGRVTPQMVARHIETLGASGKLNENVLRGVNRLHEGVQIYLNAPASLKLVPADSEEKAWLGVSTLPAGSPAQAAMLEFGKAWRAMDAAGVNSAAEKLATVLPAIHPEFYPGARREIELQYNLRSPFEWGMWLYAFSFLSLVLAFGTGRNWLRISGTVLLVGAIAIHLISFAARCYIAERYSIQNQFESMTGVSLFAAVVGLGMMLFKRQMIFAAAAAGVGFLVLIAATQTEIPGQEINREAAILNTSILLKYHVTTVLVSYGLISLGMIVSLFYLGTHYASRLRSPEVQTMTAISASGGVSGVSGEAPGGGVARVLHDLDRAHLMILQLAFWTLGVGILLGAWWADHSWGRWWAFDPKETWALVTWIIYLIVVHVRVAMSGNRGLVTAWLSVVGFIAMLWCYFGVNLLLPGLHAYA